MQAFIGSTLLASKLAQPQSEPFEISDNQLAGVVAMSLWRSWKEQTTDGARLFAVATKSLYPIERDCGKGGNRTLDPGIMSAVL